MHATVPSSGVSSNNTVSKKSLPYEKREITQPNAGIKQQTDVC